MRVLIATPCSGGMLTTGYLNSLLTTIEAVRVHKQQTANEFLKRNPPGPDIPPQQHANAIQPQFQEFLRLNTIDLGIHTMAGESLLPRGRNHLAQQTMTQQWDKLFFIDADAGWTTDDFFKIASSDKPIVVGTCPLKIFPISLNFLPFKNDEYYFKDAIRSIESLRAMKQGHGTSEIKVPFIGTAFMCIDVSVLKALAEVVPQYQYPNPMTSQLETHWDFFNCSPVNETYMSEDWGFCHLARTNGFDVYMNADVCIKHTGNWTFQAGQGLTLAQETTDVVSTVTQPPSEA